MTPSKQKSFSSQNVTTGQNKISNVGPLNEHNYSAAADRAKYIETRNVNGRPASGAAGQKNGQISGSSFRQTPPLRENDQERHLTSELMGSSSIQVSHSSSTSGAVPLVSPIISGTNNGGAKRQSNQGCGDTGSTVSPAIARPRANVPQGESASVGQPLGNQGATPYAQMLQAAKSVHHTSTTSSSHQTNQLEQKPVSTKSLVPDNSVSSQLFQFSRDSSSQKYSLVALDTAKSNGRSQRTDHLNRPGALVSVM